MRGTAQSDIALTPLWPSLCERLELNAAYVEVSGVPILKAFVRGWLHFPPQSQQ